MDKTDFENENNTSAENALFDDTFPCIDSDELTKAKPDIDPVIIVPDLLPSTQNLSEQVCPPLFEEKEIIAKEDISGTETGERGFTQIIAGVFAALLCVTFCLTSAAFWADGAAKAANVIKSKDVFDIVSSEVFDGALVREKIPETENEQQKKESATDVPPEASANKTDKKEESDAKTHSVISTDLSCDTPFLLRNETSYSPEVAKLAASALPCPTIGEIYDKYGTDAPCVLIVHTHGTECYSDGSDTYSEDDSFRTRDTKKNVIAVGDVMEAVFRACGVNVIHDRTMHDAESYRDSYSRSFSSVKATLEKNPSVSYVFDVHRDSIIADDKTKYRPVFDYDGAPAAQVMAVVGTDEGGAEHPCWKDNLTFALAFQKSASEMFRSSLTRSINLRSAAFNQALSKGSLLLEIGSCGNTLDEAKRCAVLTSIALADAMGAPTEHDAAELIRLFVESD